MVSSFESGGAFVGTLFNQPVTHDTSERVNTGLLNRPRFVKAYLQKFVDTFPMSAIATIRTAVQLAAQLNRMTALWRLVQESEFPLCRRKLEFADLNFGPLAVS